MNKLWATNTASRSQQLAS